MKRFLTLILIAMLICNTLGVCAYADDGVSTWSSNYFASYGANLTAVGGGRIKITFTATGTGTCDKIGVATYEVQEYNSDSGRWEDVSGTLTGKTGSNVTSYSFSKYFNGVSGEKYRVKCTFVSEIGSGSEYKSYTSGNVTA